MKKQLNFLHAILGIMLIGSVIGATYNVSAFFISAILGIAGYALSRSAKAPSNCLADITINDTSYAGEFLDIFITKLVTGYESLQKGLVNVLPGIKKKTTIPTLDVKNFIQAYQDTPVHGGSVDVDARVLEPKDIMGYLRFKPRQFEQHWLAVQMNPKLLDAELPITAENAIVSKTIEKNSGYMDQLIWQGVRDEAAIATAIANGLGDGDNNLIFIDGFIKRMHGDANVLKILAPTAVVLTAANIKSKFDDLKALLLAQPGGSKVLADPGFKWIVSHKTFELYADAQKAQTNKGEDFTSGGKDTYNGKKVVPIAGMFDDTIVGCIATSDMDSNLWVGVNEIDEETYLKIAPLQADSALWFIKMLCKVDVNYAIPGQTVLYTTQTFA